MITSWVWPKDLKRILFQVGNNYKKNIYVLNKKGANVAGNNLNSLPKTKKKNKKTGNR